jgi:hypothetical protein
MALCPSCNAAIHHVTIQDVTVGGLATDQWNGITYSCPACQHVLSVAIDPVALQADLVDEIVARLRPGH